MMGAPTLPSEVRRRFWSRVRAGDLPRDAAAAIGVSHNTGFRWFTEAGGVMPPSVELSGRYLSFAEREELACLKSAGHSVREIGRRMQRDPATISRELHRGAGWRGKYRASTAQSAADIRAARPKTAKLAGNERLRAEVQNRLEKKDSPEQIANRLVLDFPDDPEMRVSHETIYQSLYVQGKGALKRELTQCLRTGRALRKPRRSSTERRGRIPNMVGIAERPAEVEDRAVPGHWEGDLIVGKNSGSAIGTLVERTTRFTMLLHLPGAHGACEVEQAMITAMSQLPETLRRTLTWDQGVEMSNHVNIAAATDLDVFFCDPHSPWQRGTNENTNGLLRQYFPKGTNLSVHDRAHLDQVAAELNNRPRKTLNWRTPAEALDALLSQAGSPTGVATTP
jgi:IS30 family transposase